MIYKSFEDLYHDSYIRPRLFLAYYENIEKLVLDQDFIWKYIEHQCGGMVCHQVKIVATELNVDFSGYEKILALINITDKEEIGHRCIGIGGTNEEELAELKELLLKENLDYDDSIYLFQEGIIPIRASLKNYREFNNNFDKRYENIFNEGNDYKKAIFILYENCD